MLQPGRGSDHPSRCQEAPAVVGFLPPDEQRLLISHGSGQWTLRSAIARRLLPPIKIERGFLHFAISPDGQRIAFGGAEGLKGVWSLESGERVLPPWPARSATLPISGSARMARSFSLPATMGRRLLLSLQSSARKRIVSL